MDNEYDKKTIESLRETLETHHQAKARLDDTIMEIRRISNDISLEPKVEQTAVEKYRETLNVGLNFYPSIAELSSGAVYASCRITKTPRTRREIELHSSLPRYTGSYPTHQEGQRTSLRGGRKRKINRSYNFIIETLSLDPPHFTPSDFITNYSRRLNIEPETEEVALIVAKKIDEELKSGRSAGAIAAGILDYATNVSSENVAQKTICEHTCFSSTTVRERRVEIESNIGEGNPNSILDSNTNRGA